jgi:hypothetical protein
VDLDAGHPEVADGEDVAVPEVEVRLSRLARVEASTA